MKPVSSHFLNLSIFDTQGFGIERAEQERVLVERVEKERVEKERVEQDFLLRRLKPVETGYHRKLRCMDSTRQTLLNQITDWVSNKHGQENALQRNVYWFFSSPGIGKTSLAHSICANLHEQNHLAGAFFCRRDDPNLSEPINVLPTFIYKLAILFPPFRTIVAEHLRRDPNITPDSMEYSLFLGFIRQLPSPPKRTLVFVIDALDECGSKRSRPNILKALTDAAARTPWLRVIITSRPEADIEHFFDGLALLSHLRYDLSADEEITSDIRTFAQARFGLVALTRYLPSPWPEQKLFDEVISRAAGLFIFIESLALALEDSHDPTELLESTLQDSASAGLTSLYGLYSSIVEARKVQKNDEFRRVIGVLLITAPHHPLCEEMIAKMAGVRADLVKMWIGDLSSLLYRKEGTKGGICVRHPSISDFFFSDDCPRDYQVNLRDANVQLGIACLKTMVVELRFNICKLEDSRLANNDVNDLASRIKENISDALQYSSVNWTNHLCFTPDTSDGRVWESLREFFGGPYPLFWIEVLSIIGMLRIGALGLRGVISMFVKVCTAPACRYTHSKVILTCCRMQI